MPELLSAPDAMTFSVYSMAQQALSEAVSVTKRKGPVVESSGTPTLDSAPAPSNCIYHPDRPAHGRGLCNSCLLHNGRYGKPTTPYPPRRKWLPEETATLKEMRSRGATIKVIAKTLHRDAGFIGRQIRKFGLPQPWELPIPELGLSLAEAAYMAGFWDGDGHFTLVRCCRGKGYAPALGVANTCRDVLIWFRRKIGRESIRIHQYCPYKNQKLAFSLEIRGHNTAIGVIRAVLPYLIVRKRQAQLLLEYCLLRNGLPSRRVHVPRERRIYLELRKLNKKGMS